MALKDKDLGAILVEQSYVSEEELKASLKDAKDRGTNLITVLTERGLITQSLYENALAEHYKLPFYDIQSNPPRPDLVTKLPEDISKKYGAIVVKAEGKTITVATTDPRGRTTGRYAERCRGKAEERRNPISSQRPKDYRATEQAQS